MKRTTVFLDEALERELQALARRGRRPMASLVREAVEQYVVTARAATRETRGFVALGRSGRHDVAERHEALLFQQDVLEEQGARRARRTRPPRAGPAPTPPAGRGRRRP